MKLETPDPTVIARHVRKLNLSGEPIRARDLLFAVYGDSAIGTGSATREAQSRAIDRGLQRAKRKGLVSYDSKRGWRYVVQS